MSRGDRYSLEGLREDLGAVVVGRSELPLSSLDMSTTGEAYASQLGLAVDLFYNSEWASCRDRCKLVLDITWERLNTGHWKDIDICWRHCYTLVSLLKTLSEYALSHTRGHVTVAEAIKTCDMGLLMGAPLMGNILTKVAQTLQDKAPQRTKQLHAGPDSVAKRHRPSDREPVAERYRPSDREPVAEVLIDPAKAVGVLQCPSLQRFQTCHMDRELPVILEGTMDFWPAMGDRRWTLEYLKVKAGCRTVPVELGSRYTEDSWSQSLMTLADFIDWYIEGGSGGRDGVTGYLAQHQLFHQIPELQNDISVPSYCALSPSGEGDGDVDINAWLGPQGTVSPLHQDPKHNLLAQVVGRKYVRLYARQHTASVYPHTSPIFSNTSQVDVEHPDHDRFPEFSRAPYTECVLSPGQMLYIPPKHWHYVRALSTSFSVSFWWE